MSKVLAVFGATGAQGGSVVRNVLADPEVAKLYKVRVLTRDPNSEAVKSLGNQVEAVKADLEDAALIEKALTGVNTVFLVSNPIFTPGDENKEREQIQLVADIAVKTGVEYLIFSTLPHISKLSQGKYTHAAHFDGKALAEEYIRTLPIKSAFISVAGYFSNYLKFPFFIPRKAEDGTYVVFLTIRPDTKFPLVDCEGDVGKFVNAILFEPEKYQGHRIAVTEHAYTQEEVAKVLSKSSGKKVVYKQVSLEEFTTGWPFKPERLTDVFDFVDQFGYYVDEPDWQDAGKKVARGKLTSLEEYFEANPLKLE